MFAQYNHGISGSGGAALMDCCVISTILIVVVVCLIVAAWWKGDNYYQPPKSTKHPILVGRHVEFTLEGDKLVRGKVTSQQEDKLGISWMNRRGEIKHTYRTIAKISLVEES